MLAMEKGKEGCNELFYLSQNLVKLMSQKNIDTKQLSALTDISVSSLNMIKRGEGNPTLGVLVTLANFFDISIESLICQEEKKLISIHPIPIFELQVAHEINKHKPVNYAYVDIGNEENFLNFFAVCSRNSSLMPFFEKGSIFLISPDIQYVDGDLVLIRINDCANAFRRVFVKNSGYHFRSISLDSDLHHYDHYKVIGTVLKVIHNMRMSDESK